MSTFVLVHGAWHGGWCWYKLVAQLERAGHQVLAPDLPGMGRDRTPLASVTLQLWSDYLCSLVEQQREPVVLVGHSRGGVLISEVAQRHPQKIARLVYLTAFLLPNGRSLSEEAAQIEGSSVMPNIVVAADQMSGTMRSEVIAEAFYGECSSEDIALAQLCLGAEPLAPLATPITVSAERFGRVPRAYIECTRDRAIPLDFQRKMQGHWPCAPVLSIDTDHSPFFSRPAALAKHLLALGA
ncbi:MAG TPA: alpha/beta fold hydrolase [Steroidobacteraceae bacterium]